MTTYSMSIAASLERAFRHWRERGALLELPRPKPLPMTIAISRQCGAGGAAIAGKVAETINWPLYDRQLIDEIAKDAGVQAQLLEKLDEQRPNWLAECLEGLSEEKRMSGVGFAIRLRKVLLALYCHGDCIVLGRGAAQIMPADQTLRVRLVAPIDLRVARVASRTGMSGADASKRVAEVDHARAEFVKSYFHKDPADYGWYDMTIDTSRFSDETCRDLILCSLRGRREQVKMQRHSEPSLRF
jgi:cytidylate kinase